MGYWITTFGLLLFGVVAMLSIGRPFFLVGLALLLLSSLRTRPAFWPANQAALLLAVVTIVMVLAAMTWLRRSREPGP